MELENIELKNLKYALFVRSNFLPMFLATFLGTFNDNLIRSALVVLIAYSAHDALPFSISPEIMVTLCSAILIIPMVIFSSLAGEMADKYDKARLIVYTKIAEIFIMAAAAYGFYYQHIPLLMVTLFASGTHSAFYVPIKFSILPQHLKKGELLAANGFIASGSYLAILAGMICGGILITTEGLVIGKVILTLATLGFIASLFIPPAPSTHPETLLCFNLWRGSCNLIKTIWHDALMRKIILALSWFITVGSVYISQFANYARSEVHANNEVYIIFLTVFSVGVAIGSLLCDTILKGQISARFTPLSAIGISLFTTLMVVTTPTPENGNLMTIHEFFSVSNHWLMVASMLMVAVFGGIYIVPLYALLQEHSKPSHRSQVIAASNLSDSIGMTIAAVISALLLYIGLSIKDLFIIIAFITIGVAFYVRRISAD